MAPGRRGCEPGRPTGGCGGGVAALSVGAPTLAQLLPLPPVFPLSPDSASAGWAGGPLGTAVT